MLLLFEQTRPRAVRIMAAGNATVHIGIQVIATDTQAAPDGDGGKVTGLYEPPDGTGGETQVVGNLIDG